MHVFHDHEPQEIYRDNKLVTLLYKQLAQKPFECTWPDLEIHNHIERGHFQRLRCEPQYCRTIFPYDEQSYRFVATQNIEEGGGSLGLRCVVRYRCFACSESK